MHKIITIVLDGYDKCKHYLENADLVVFIAIAIAVLYFLMYLISFFFKLPFIIIVAFLIAYYFYRKKYGSDAIKII